MIEKEFMYLVYQPYPTNQKVYYWVDGEPHKQIISLEEFIKTLRHRNADSIPKLYDSLNTYSFYFLSLPDMELRKLEANTNNEPYPDEKMKVVATRKPAPQHREKKRDRTIEDVLMAYGFSAVNESDFKDLRVTLGKRKDEEFGFFSRFFNRSWL